ncbi:aspartate/glutamate racemase family protein [Motilimonas eburnea]|uniref:aspartate/glutamate racemase family protein n=1 Tax=Motilimonas eburnea TaxID=1737488 RepID=UPI001E4F5416|nr:aspartate/glutamate racemase family protein [Motilimonas eburnea]MCE2570506.1 aspartate/glutamate racemase family protein [Motilimonas eburnea]
MKTIGLIGGMSWESTVSYYQALNRGVKAQMGGLHSAKLCLFSLDFDEIEKLQRQGDWPKMTQILTDAAQAVERAGADFLMICTNTMHKVAPEIAANISIPILHIADATGTKLKDDGITKVGLLGTRFTMAQDFYKGRISQHFDIEVLVPTEDEQTQIHDIIYNELCQGVIKPESKDIYSNIISLLHQKGAQGIILGCTEIALLINQGDTDVPLYDTTAIHAEQGIQWALSR